MCYKRVNSQNSLNESMINIYHNNIILICMYVYTANKPPN